ncbi:MAG: hypothetical protein K2N65_00635, partial [Anaeroplasmataceae bacterium]|nr:hypothetical protein [Anaeroplasmataceae bacterium]
MATFDDKSIFSRRKNEEEPKEKTEVIEETVEEQDTEMSEEMVSEEENLALSIEEDASGEDKVIGEELIESETVRKQREKKEKKEKKLADKQYALMVKNHRKAMKKNPENIKRYETDVEKGLSAEI